VIVNGSDESAARAAAIDASPNGETRVREGWLALQLSASDLADGAGPLWIEGNVIAPGELSRGGHRIGETV